MQHSTQRFSFSLLLRANLEFSQQNVFRTSALAQYFRSIYEYAVLVTENLTLSSNAYGSVFYIATGFHGLHVTGGLIAFLIVMIRVAKARRFTHQQATTAIVVSYYWHFVDVVWIALFAAIYLIK